MVMLIYGQNMRAECNSAKTHVSHVHVSWVQFVMTGCEPDRMDALLGL